MGENLLRLLESNASLRIRSETCTLPSVKGKPHWYNCYTKVSIQSSPALNTTALASTIGVRFSLRWKGLFIDAEPDPTLPRSNDGLFWCMHTQTCIGPDGKLAEPGNCHHSDRKCHSNCGS